MSAELDREVEIGRLAARLRVFEWGRAKSHASAPEWEHGARAGLTAYRACYELAVFIAPLLDEFDFDDIGDLVRRAEAALERARG